MWPLVTTLASSSVTWYETSRNSVWFLFRAILLCRQFDFFVRQFLLYMNRRWNYRSTYRGFLRRWRRVRSLFISSWIDKMSFKQCIIFNTLCKFDCFFNFWLINVIFVYNDVTRYCDIAFSRVENTIITFIILHKDTLSRSLIKLLPRYNARDQYPYSATKHLKVFHIRWVSIKGLIKC